MQRPPRWYLSLVQEGELGLRGFDSLVGLPPLQEMLGHQLDHLLLPTNTRLLTHDVHLQQQGAPTPYGHTSLIFSMNCTFLLIFLLKCSVRIFDFLFISILLLSV